MRFSFIYRWVFNGPYVFWIIEASGPLFHAGDAQPSGREQSE